jgi:predicted nicotinamide N-methyase
MEELMKLQRRKIRLDSNNYINLNEQTLFKANGEEGLHLWESSVLFSRYIKKNHNLFENKNIIELGSGCGLLGITCLLHTKCKHLTFTDYQQSVIENLLKNIELNKINHQHLSLSTPDGISENNSPYCISCFPGRYSILNLDWRDYDKYKSESYDYIIGSELIYSGGHIEELVKLIKNLLKSDGKAMIVMPEKRSMTNKFLEYLSENNLSYESKYFKDECEDIFDQILEDQKESKKLFEDLLSMKIMIYTIFKNSE